jgi:hypothetical protein
VKSLTDETIYKKIGEIVALYELYQCYDCAKAIIKWLKKNGVEGKIIELKNRYIDEDFIISDRLGSDESISINGKHYGVEVCGLVFDNLSTVGMTRQEWLNDFHCPSEEFVVNEL